MKYRILILLLVILVSVFCSCDKIFNKNDHTHDFSDTFSHDDTHHWYECGGCEEKDGYEQHSWNKGVVTLQPTIESEGERIFTCSVCRAQKTQKIDKLTEDHLHTYDILNSDDNHHWYECVCGEKDSSAEHKWDDGVITTNPTEDSDGVKTYTCTVCARKYTEAVSKVKGLSFLKSTHYRISEKLAKTPLTFEAEIYVDPSISGRAGAIFGNYYGIRQDWLLEIYENGVPRFYFTDAAGNIKDYRFDKVDVRSEELVHIALVIDYANKGVHFYLDGVLAQTVAMDIDLAPDITKYQFVLGGDNRSDNGIYFRGKIRSLSAYSDVRTAEEIKASVQNGTDLHADNLLLSYLLDENSAGKDIVDLSGNGYTIHKEWLDSHEPTLDYAYSFAVVGDTQWLSKYTPEKMEGIYDWILANKDSKKISHVFGLGDITEDWNTANKEEEWIRVQQYISKLDGAIPYSLVRGNHDESKYFFKYFANGTYMSQFDGFMGGDDISNSYKLFTVGSTDYLFLTLDFGPSDEMLAWANEVVLAHPNHRVIVTTHGYQGFDGNHLSYDNTPSSGGMGSGNDVDTSAGEPARGYNNGVQVWDKFISKHPNIFLVMSGHTPHENVLVMQSEGNHGNTVTQMLIDPQWMDPQKGGVGMVAMLYFSADGTQMEVEWISTDTGKYYKEQNQFTLDLTNSFNAPAHDFHDSYDEKSHHKACDCGYTYNAEPHVFDGGVFNADGFMEYSCACGYKRMASATNDPVALELQAVLQKFYNGGVYYKETLVNSNPTLILYNGDKFFVASSSENMATNEYLTLDDIVLGKYGDLRLDLGWNHYDGVYSSANADTVKGVASFVMTSEDNSANKVTVETDGEHLIIKLYADDSLIAECEIGSYVTTTLVDTNGDFLEYLYTKADKNGICEIYTPAISGYVCEYDKIIVDTRHSALTRIAYYSTVSVWDGVSVSTSLKGEGTESNPYLVESGADLAYIAGEVNKVAAKAMTFSGKYFKLTQSIDLNGHELFIGGSSEWATRQIFAGMFDGNHCTIRGLKNSRSLFAAVEGGWLKNLSVYGTVTGAGNLGGIVGYVANGGILENLTSYVTVNGTSTLGGIVANAENNASTVINCVNYGNVTGSSWNIGGIAGSGGHDVLGCVNFGNVHSTGSDNIGGIAGTTKNTGSISDCYNYGNISSVHGRVGGIVGWLNKLVVNCVNYGSINAGWDSGGVVGYVNEGESAVIKNCINNGNVKGNTGIGGIFGFNHASAGSILIKDCINNGEVAGTWGVGGIAGNTKAEISGCVNNGKLDAKGELGGIVGKCYGKVTECTNRGEVRGAQDIIGGIVGHLHDTTCYSIIVTTNEQKGTVTGPNAGQIFGKIDGVVEELITLNKDVIGINHRGWYEAPENTLSAYRESAKQGFKYVECDVQFTKDGVAVLLHDNTIDRTSNGSGKIGELTYAELLQYDFSYDDNDTDNDFSAYRGEKIPTFAEFIALCKELSLHPYIEIKGTISEDEAALLVKIVSDAGMLDNVSWLSFSGDALAKIASLDKGARIVWVMTDTDATKIEVNSVPFAKESLMTGENEVVFDLWHSLAKQDVVDLLSANGILLEVWTVNDAATMLKLHPYVTGVTSDKYDASQLAEKTQ